MTTGTGVVGTDFRYFFALKLGNGSARTGAAASVTARVRNPGNTATDLPAVTEVGFGQYFIDIASAFTTIHGVGQYGVLLEVTTAPRDTFSESVTFDSIAPSGIPGLVWDELTAAHVLAGSFGLLVGTNLDATISGVPAATDAVLSAAHGAGSWLSAVPPTVAAIVAGVWSEPLPGAFAAGTAGFHLDVPVSLVPAATDVVLTAAHGAGLWTGASTWSTSLGLGVFGAGEAGTMLFELFAIRGLQLGAPADWGPTSVLVPGAGVTMTIGDVGAAKRVTRVP